MSTDKMAGELAKNFYDVLGVPKKATEAQVRAAYLALVKKWHPDLAEEKDRAFAEVKFKEIRAAYDTLLDRAKRRDYDADLMAMEVSGLPRDEIDRVMDSFTVSQYAEEPVKRKRKRGRSRGRRAAVELGEIPDGFSDDSLNELLGNS